MAIVNELVTKFSFIGSTSALGQYNNLLASSISLLVRFGAVSVIAAAGVASWATNVLAGVASLSALSFQTRISVASIQELSFAAEQNGSSANAMQSSLQSLSRTIGNAALRGSDDFARLGISVRDSNGHVKRADQILGEIGARFRQLNLSISEQESFASALGIDSSLLQLLNRSSGEIASLRDRARELGVITKEQTEQAVAYRQSLSAVKFGINSIAQLIAVGLAPWMQRLAERFGALIAANKDWIVSAARATVEWIARIAEAIGRLLPVFALVIASMGALRIAALGVAGVMALLGKAVPVVAISAAILAIDDLIVAFRGGQSVIADFFRDKLGVDIVKALTVAFDALGTAMQWVVDRFRELFGFAELFFAFGANAGGFVRGFLTDLFGGITGGLGQVIESGGGLHFGGATTAAAALGSPRPPLSAAANSADNRSIQQNNTINVRSSDPSRAAREVDSALQRQLENAQQQLGAGGL